MSTTVQQKHTDGWAVEAAMHTGNSKQRGGVMDSTMLTPTLHEPACLLLASSGFYVRINEDGSASLVDGIQDITIADFTPAEIEGIAYGLNNKVGNTR